MAFGEVPIVFGLPKNILGVERRMGDCPVAPEVEYMGDRCPGDLAFNVSYFWGRKAVVSRLKSLAACDSPGLSVRVQVSFTSLTKRFRYHLSP